MVEQEYWSFGRKEIACISGGCILLTVVSFVLRVAPPWWFLPLPRRVTQHFDKWAQYAQQGGYDEFWLQSLIGWAIVGAVLGLIFSNVVLRGKSWD